MSSILEEILKEYNNDKKIKIKDPVKVESLLKSLIHDGAQSLQVITDFDFTLTRFKQNDDRCVSSHGILDNSELMDEKYRQQSDILFKKFYPIEIDHSLTVEEKIPHMITWYTKSHDLLAELRLPKNKIRDMVKTSRALLRDSAKDALELLHKFDVPTMVFSAGLGDILEEVLIRENAFYPNIKVISNYMEFDQEERLVRFKEPLIHMFNKNETVIEHGAYFDELTHRKNALVLGDSAGDVHMSDGMENPAALLKIGFLNDNIMGRMDSFIELFDIVLIDDQSFDLVNLILRRVLRV